MNNAPEITVEVGLEIIRLFDPHPIDVCIDGGWGVDALPGRQTRKHEDVDIAIPHKDVIIVRTLLETT